MYTVPAFAHIMIGNPINFQAYKWPQESLSPTCTILVRVTAKWNNEINKSYFPKIGEMRVERLGTVYLQLADSSKKNLYLFGYVMDPRDIMFSLQGPLHINWREGHGSAHFSKNLNWEPEKPC